ncbi:MAG: hypothetical protein ABIX28_22975 [Vicinamibacterales bacterium]
MKMIQNLTISFVLGAVGARAPVPVQPTPSDFLLTTGRAGRVELGTSVDEIYGFFGREHVRLVDLFKEGLFSPALQITRTAATAAPDLVTDIREWPCGEFSVWGIDLRDARYRTKDGLGVGSTAAELRRLYSFKISEAEGAHAAIVDALKVSFSVSREGPVDQQRVTSVWIWPDPEAVRKKRCPERLLAWPANPQLGLTRR